MSQDLPIVFCREIEDQPAYLEYSWVPGDGHRHRFPLKQNQTSDSQVNTTPDVIELIQVYELSSGNLEGVKQGENFEFPPPGRLAVKTTLTYASVQLLQHLRIAIFTAHFADGSTYSSYGNLKQR